MLKLPKINNFMFKNNVKTSSQNTFDHKNKGAYLNKNKKKYFHLLKSFKNLKIINYRLSPNTAYTSAHKPYHLLENSLLAAYTSLAAKFSKTSALKQKFLKHVPVKSPILNSSSSEKAGYLKHLVRLRYRWHFRSELGQFKIFRKFFKRSLKKYRKIQKNQMFVNKLRNNFSKLTGFNEQFLYTKWLRVRRNYNQYWAATNSVLRFSQSLLLAPYGILVLLKIAPSLAASKYTINTGAITINGRKATVFTDFTPGDILQVDLTVFKAAQTLFNYQKWTSLQHGLNLPYLQIDWSSLLIMLMRWPRKYELVAPSFLAERWIRYYIRCFPSKAVKFRPAKYNTKIYKYLINKK